MSYTVIVCLPVSCVFVCDVWQARKAGEEIAGGVCCLSCGIMSGNDYTLPITVMCDVGDVETECVRCLWCELCV